MLRDERSPICRQFAINFNALRCKRELTLKQLSVITHYSTQWLKSLEAGAVNASIDTLAKLASALECSPHELLLPSRLEPELTADQQAEYAKAAGLPPA